MYARSKHMCGMRSQRKMSPVRSHLLPHLGDTESDLDEVGNEAQRRSLHRLRERRSRAEKSPVIVREIDLNCCSYFVNGETILTNSKSPGSLGKNWAVGSVIDLEQ